MSEPVQKNMEAPLGDATDQGRWSGNRASCNVPPNLSEIAQIPPQLAGNMGNPNYSQTLVCELKKQIPPVPPVMPPKDDKVADRVV